MANKWRGVCIGGVADGHLIERDEVEIKIDARRKARTEINLDGTTKDIEETIETSHYKFLILLDNQEGRIGVWALQGMTIMQVIERMARCYNPRTGLIGVPKPNALPIKAH